MTGQELRQLVLTYLSHVLDDGGHNAERHMMNLARDVELKTRQRAHRLAMEATKAIAALNYSDQSD